MKKLFVTAVAAFLASGGAMAQYYYVSDFTLNPTTVSNEGWVVGGYGKDTPFILWKPLTDEQAYVIGGMSAGENGAAGPARITADGKTVIGSMWQDRIEVPTVWTRSLYESFPYSFRFAKKGSDFNYFIAGVSEDGKSSYVLKSSNNGTGWKDNMNPFRPIEGAVTCLTCLNASTYVLGTDAGKVYTSKGSPDWPEATIVGPEGSAAIKSVLAMDFVRTDVNDKAPVAYGAMGVALEDGTSQVWYTVDAGDTFAVSEGVSGTPTHITHYLDTLWLTTAEGGIYKSTDKGVSWTAAYTAEGVPFKRISFNDADKGVVITDALVMVTTDGGKQWRTAVVEAGATPFAEGDADVWNDVLWADGQLAVAGNNGRFYVSVDDGKSFKRQEMTDAGENENYTLVMFDRNVFNLFADGSVFYRKTLEPAVAGYGPGRYDVASDTWTPMASFGIVADNQVASTWGISDDGEYATGILRYFNEDTKSSQGGAAVWSNNGVTPLVNTEALKNHTTRANRISNDGSVVVGFTDCLGPWLASVWRRQTDGSYEHQVLMKDPEKKIEDVNLEDFNEVTSTFLGNALALSRNGQWVGGTGGNWYATEGAWIWSEESGLIELGAAGATVEVTDDGTMAVGRGDGGLGAWIWTKEGGAKELNSYVTELGGDTSEAAICGFYAMSPNGRFLTGYAYDNNMQPHGYLVDLKPETDDVERMAADQVKAAVYPNPVVNELHVDLPYDSNTVKTTITLYDMQGGACRRLSDCRQSNVIDVTGLADGIYLLDVQSGMSHKVFKVIVK